MHIVVLTTAKDTKEAKKIAKALVSDKLIACANITKDIHSFFWWQGKIDQAKEVLIIMKSKKQHLNKIIKKVKTLHSYDVPEVIALPVVGGHKGYLDWVTKSLQ